MRRKRTTPTEELVRFVTLTRSGHCAVTEICERAAVSRKTGCKYPDRFALEGLKVLQPRSHRSHHFPQRTEPAVKALIVSGRRFYRTWRPNTLHHVLQIKHEIETPGAQRHRQDQMPARATLPAARRAPALGV